MLIALGAVGDRPPGRDVLDHDRDLGDADRRAQQLERPLLVDRLGDVRPWRVRICRDDLGSRRVADQVDHEEAAVAGPVQAEEPAQDRVRDVVDALVAPLEQRGQVDLGAEVDRDAVRQQAVAAHGDPELLAHWAAVPIRSDHILGANGRLGTAAIEIAQGRGDPGVVLRQRRALHPVAKLGAELLGPGPEDRLERVLVDEQPHGRAELFDARVQVREVARDLATRERLDVVDAAVGVVLLLPLAPDLLLEAGRAKDLDRAQLEVAGARVDRRARVSLDRQAADPVKPQEQRGREADQAAADDQDIGVIAHPVTVSRSSR